MKRPGMKKLGSRTFYESFKHAFEGIARAFEYERNLKIHFTFGIAILILSIFLEIPREDILWLIFAVFSVIGAELINSLVEGLMDVYSKERDPMIKFVKDVSAGIVLWYSMFSVVVGIVVLGKALFDWSEFSGKIVALIFLVIFPAIFVWEAVMRNVRR